MLFAAGCGGEQHATPAADAGTGNEGGAPAGNRVPIPPAVRRNLALSFAEAEYRAVTRTRIVPGWFEPRPSAEHHYAMPTAGRVRVRIEPLQEVAVGDPLFEIDAPAWRALQRELTTSESALADARARETQARAAQLAARRIAAGDAEREPGEPDVYAADLAAARAAIEAARQRQSRLLAEAATLTGYTTEQLSAQTDGEPFWQSLTRVPVTATAPGRVREIRAATGAWLGEGQELVHVVDPTRLRFRGRALQADLHELRDGLPCRLVQPQGRRRDIQRVGEGNIRLGVTGDADSRTVDIYVDVAEPLDWMRPQVAAMCEIVVAGSEFEELAIPRRAVVRDGTSRVFFRRDPQDPDVAIRTELDGGPTDGTWITVYSGIAEGHEVVVDGVYELKLATSDVQRSSAHVHPDGTVCEDEDH